MPAKLRWLSLSILFCKKIFRWDSIYARKLEAVMNKAGCNNLPKKRTERAFRKISTFCPGGEETQIDRMGTTLGGTIPGPSDPQQEKSLGQVWHPPCCTINVKEWLLPTTCMGCSKLLASSRHLGGHSDRGLEYTEELMLTVLKRT